MGRAGMRRWWGGRDGFVCAVGWVAGCKLGPPCRHLSISCNILTSPPPGTIHSPAQAVGCVAQPRGAGQLVRPDERPGLDCAGADPGGGGARTVRPAEGQPGGWATCWSGRGACLQAVLDVGSPALTGSSTLCPPLTLLPSALQRAGGVCSAVAQRRQPAHLLPAADRHVAPRGRRCTGKTLLLWRWDSMPPHASAKHCHCVPWPPCPPVSTPLHTFPGKPLPTLP